MSHLDEHTLLSDRQHAFRKSHSCETQLFKSKLFSYGIGGKTIKWIDAFFATDNKDPVNGFC